MDERLDIIFSRRSIRRYTGEPISERDLTIVVSWLGEEMAIVAKAKGDLRTD